ncbi:hypothetical protein BH10PSE7_BH10PSE7_30900 [soil metagenome]
MMQSSDLKPRVEAVRSTAVGWESGRKSSEGADGFDREIDASRRREESDTAETPPKPGGALFPGATFLTAFPMMDAKPALPSRPEPSGLERGECARPQSDTGLLAMSEAPDGTTSADDSANGVMDVIQDATLEVHFDTAHLYPAGPNLTAGDPVGEITLLPTARPIEPAPPIQPLKVLKLELDSGREGGTVTATLRLRGQTLDVRIEAGRGALGTELHDHAERLTQALNQAGYVTETVIVEKAQSESSLAAGGLAPARLARDDTTRKPAGERRESSHEEVHRPRRISRRSDILL